MEDHAKLERGALEVRQEDVWRPSRRQSVAGFLAHPDTVAAAMVTVILFAFLAPMTWPLLLVIMIVYPAWLRYRRFRLPFRIPLSWGDIDWSDRKPGRNTRARKDYNRAEGLLYLGVDEQGQELHISNSDARRHAFVLGTTGSGKALPDDMPLLTPEGWRRHDAIKPGDKVISAAGEPITVIGVHPQGEQPLWRLEVADGRMIDCTADHLWAVRLLPPENTALIGQERVVMSTSDLAMNLAAADVLETPQPMAFIDLITPWSGEPAQFMGIAAGRQSALHGLKSVIAAPLETLGTVTQRRDFLAGFLAAGKWTVGNGGWIEIATSSAGEARALRALGWSLGGHAWTVSEKPGAESSTACIWIPAAENILDKAEAPAAAIEALRPPPPAMQIVSVGPLDNVTAPVRCLRLDAKAPREPVYVAGQFVPTHNTEFLLGLVSQTMTWASGFLFVDGKGTTEMFARVWTLARRFGREDDVRVVNFIGVASEGGLDADAPSGSIFHQSNTMNPFSDGTADQISNMIGGLMSESDASGDMWKDRANQLVRTLVRVLVELRDRGEILLDVQTLRDYMPLGIGVAGGGVEPRNAEYGDDTETATLGVEDLTARHWQIVRQERSMCALYLRALNGEFTDATKLAFSGFFDSLPDFDLQKCFRGEKQGETTQQQYGYLTMQLTRPLGTMADDFSHIFRTPLGEVDMKDIVYQRRILIVLLPALQKSSSETRNLGKIIVTMAKSMMGSAAGARVIGTYEDIIESAPTRSKSPFLAVFDEAGYYLVEGLDVMCAQARSLGFSIIVGAQDLQAMRKTQALASVADSVIANTFLCAAGATVDASDTLQFLERKLGQMTVGTAGSIRRIEGLAGGNFRDRPDVSFERVARMTESDFRDLPPGEFVLVFRDRVLRSRTFYIGSTFSHAFAVNKFLKVRGPCDQEPGLDQSEEERWTAGLQATLNTLRNLNHNGDLDTVSANDTLQKQISSALTDRAGQVSMLVAPDQDRTRDAAARGRLEPEIESIFALRKPFSHSVDTRKSVSPRSAVPHGMGACSAEKSEAIIGSAYPGHQGPSLVAENTRAPSATVVSSPSEVSISDIMAAVSAVQNEVEPEAVAKVEPEQEADQPGEKTVGPSPAQAGGPQLAHCLDTSHGQSKDQQEAARILNTADELAGAPGIDDESAGTALALEPSVPDAWDSTTSLQDLEAALTAGQERSTDASSKPGKQPEASTSSVESADNDVTASSTDQERPPGNTCSSESQDSGPSSSRNSGSSSCHERPYQEVDPQQGELFPGPDASPSLDLHQEPDPDEIMESPSSASELAGGPSPSPAPTSPPDAIGQSNTGEAILQDSPPQFTDPSAAEALVATELTTPTTGEGDPPPPIAVISCTPPHRPSRLPLIQPIRISPPPGVRGSGEERHPRARVLHPSNPALVARYTNRQGRPSADEH